MTEQAASLVAPSSDPTPAQIALRREHVYIILCGFFLSAMALLNVVGITKFIQLGPLSLAVGVLPYPLTFLCTDLVSELYGRKRANFLVWMGLVTNLFVIGMLWLANALPGVSADKQPPWQTLSLSKPVALPDGSILADSAELLELVYKCTAGAVLASMFAYLAAQFIDVALFHFWKRLTRGKHLWLRNNGSTVFSQLVDSFMVIAITFGAAYGRGEITGEVMLVLFWSNYAFKLAAALVDTVPFYVLTKWLSRYLRLDPTAEHDEPGMAP